MFLGLIASPVEDAPTFRRAVYCNRQSLSDSPQKQSSEVRPKVVKVSTYDAVDKNHENLNDKSNTMLFALV